jgi:hypothetical protein
VGEDDLDAAQVIRLAVRLNSRGNGMNSSILLTSLVLSCILVGCAGYAASREVTGSEFIRMSQRPKPGEHLSFWKGDDGYYHLECYWVSTKSKPKTIWVVRTLASNLRPSDIELLEQVNFKSTPEGLRFGATNHASAIDISGAEFVQKVEQRKPGEKFVLRRNDRAGFFYADWFVMPPTQSVFKLQKTFRTSTNELSAERFEALKKKVAEEDAKSPFPH